MINLASTEDLQGVLQELTHPQVRDLAWVIGSPKLLDQLPLESLPASWAKDFESALCIVELSPREALKEAIPHLRSLELNPVPLLNSLERSAQVFTRVRLGVYYEHLVYYWLNHIIQVDELLRELQVYSDPAKNDSKGRRTLGALDMIARLSKAQLNTLCRPHLTQSESSSSLHLELASKFYLQVPSDESHEPLDGMPQPLFTWIGPNERDSFGGKLHRLYTHQLSLSKTPEAISALRSRGYHINLRSLWLKGRLFFHLSALSSPDSLEPLKNNSGRGLPALWCRQGELDQLFNLYQKLTSASVSEVRASLRPKPQWLAPPTLAELRATPTHTQALLKEGAMNSRGERGSTLWYVASADLSFRGWLMIVPDDWGRREPTR